MCTGAEVWAISTSSDLGVRARAFAGFFSSSLLVVVCLGKKKGSLLRRPLWIVASPIPRTSCSTYATRPCLPPSKMGETPPFPYPPNGVSNPHFTPHPHREHTHAPPTFRELRGGGGSVPARSDSRGGGLLELYPACSCLIALFILKKPCSSQLRASVCACVCVCLCVHVSAPI